MDYDMKRNGSGYYDETPAKAFEGMAKPGEIWTVGHGAGEKEILVIKNHGKFCNVLNLLNKSKDKNCIEIIGHTVRCTDPRLLAYQFSDNLAQFVHALSEDEFEKVLDEIEYALELVLYQDVNKDLLEAAEKKVEALEAELREAKAQAAQIKQTAPVVDTHYKDLYQKLVFDLIDRGLMGVVLL